MNLQYMSLISILEMTQAFQFFESTNSINHSYIYLLQLTLTHDTGLEYQGFRYLAFLAEHSIYPERSCIISVIQINERLKHNFSVHISKIYLSQTVHNGVKT